jgi:hypothetical protein
MVQVELPETYVKVDLWRADSFQYEEDVGYEVDIDEGDIVLPKVQVGRKRQKGTPLMLEPGTEEVVEVPEEVAMKFMKEAFLIQPELPAFCEVVSHDPLGETIIVFSPTPLDAYEFVFSPAEARRVRFRLRS